MLCKKCGATIENNSKFCGYCGELLTQVNSLDQNLQGSNQTLNTLQPEASSNNQFMIEELNNQPIQNEEVLNIFGNVNNNIQNTTLEQSTILNEISKNDVNLEPINNELKLEETNINKNLNVVQPNLEIPNENINLQNEPTILPINENNVSINEISNTLKSNVENSSSIELQPINNEANIVQTTNESTNMVQPIVETPNIATNNQPVNSEGSANKAPNKNNKKLFIIIGAVLGVIAVILLGFSFLKGSGSSISVLKKAIANFKLNSQNSFTINANLTAVDSDNKENSFDALIKSQKKSENETNMQIVVNKTELFDEINSYLVFKDNKAELYLQSTLIDLLGLTSSLDPIWVNNSVDLDEVQKDNNEEISLEQLIDEEHFILIDKVNGVKHYQLIIDQKIIDDIKVKFADSENETIKSLIESDETIEKPIKIDFYISKSDEIEKIDINLLNYFGENVEMNKMLLSLKFSNFNNTTVDVPNEVKNGIYDLQTYMATHAVEFNFDFDSNVDF